MRGEGLAVHATAVAISGRALLIRGPSRSGKSRLACALITASTKRRPIRLIGDDRILLTPTAFGLVARPHPRIAGFMERRGLGIVAMAHVAMAPLCAIVDLGGAESPDRRFEARLRRLALDESVPPDSRSVLVLAWWIAGESATSASHSPAKAAAEIGTLRKD